MLHIIIFSYNRAMQLNSLLESIIKHVKDTQFHTTVVYNSGNDFYEEGYQLLKKRYSAKNISFVREAKSQHKFGKTLLWWRNLYRYIKYERLRNPKSNFKELTEHIINQSSAEFFMFLVDDVLIFRDISIPRKVFERIQQHPMDTVYSISNAYNWLYKPSSLEEIDKNLYAWNFYKNDSKKEWSFPFSVTGKIFSSSFLKKVLPLVAYSNPSTMESYVCDYVRERKMIGKGLGGHDFSLLMMHINQVQNEAQKNLALSIDLEFLNKKLLEGWNMEYVLKEEPKHYEMIPSGIAFIRDNVREELSLDNKLTFF